MNIQISDLHASIEDKKILNGVSMNLETGKLTVLMGPNGSGKSTVSNVIMGNPNYEVGGGDIVVNNESILELEPHERAKKGLFMSFQYPVEVPGITVGRFLRRAYEALHETVPAGFVSLLRKEMDILGIDHSFINRYLNEGFSGGEKKRMEILQMRVLKPSFAILDEVDSGLDIDAIKVIARGINAMREENQSFSVLVVTHYKRIIDHLTEPDVLYVMHEGKVVATGGMDTLDKLEAQGYGWLLKE